MAAAAAALGLWCAGVTGPALGQVASFAVTGDAIVLPLDGRSGDPARGRAVVLDRAVGNCLICHRVPEPSERFMGDVGPDLTGVGARLSAGQIRLRVVDQTRFNPGSIMPPYHRIDGLTRVAGQHRGRPVLDAQQVEDVVAWLESLR